MNSITDTEVEMAYRLILNRAASQEEIVTMRGQHDSLTGVRNAMLFSREFERKTGQVRTPDLEKMPPALVYAPIPGVLHFDLVGLLRKSKALKPDAATTDATIADLLGMPYGRRRRLRFIYGDVTADLEHKIGVPCKMLCVIRAAGPRLFSIYQSIIDTPDHPAHGFVRERGLSFGAYLEFSLDSVPHRLELDNGQMRRLSGRFTGGSLGQERDLVRLALHRAFSPLTMMGFAEEFDLIATELFASGFIDEASRTKCGKVPLPPGYEPAVEALSPYQRQIFTNYTAWDTYFYDLCRGLIFPAIR